MKIIYLLAILPLIVTERSVSARGLAIIKEFEGFSATAYRCPAGVWTIGYGTTDSDKSITGTSIYPGLTISEAKASEWLKKSVDLKYGKNVNKFDHIYHWTQNEFDAMVSFAYNLGSINKLCGNGSKSKSQIANDMLNYVHAAGRVLPGLVRRRKMERELFLSKSEGKPEKAFCQGKTLTEIAKEVIDGKWGNGNNRTNKLRNAGCDPNKVQKEVNRLLQ